MDAAATGKLMQSEIVRWTAVAEKAGIAVK
jgi:hypothetical protein